MGNAKKPLHVKDMSSARSTSSGSPFRTFLLFADVEGVANVGGREVVVTLSGDELADAVGSVVQAAITSGPALEEEDVRALTRAMRFLRGEKVPGTGWPR